MFDVGWQELFVIGIVAVIVIGPKDLPRVLRTVTMGIRKIRGMAREFQDSIEELAREADLHELRKEIEQVGDTDFEKDLQTIIDPDREIEKSVEEIGRSLDETAAPDTGTVAASETAEPAAAETASSAGEEPVASKATPAAIDPAAAEKVASADPGAAAPAGEEPAEAKTKPAAKKPRKRKAAAKKPAKPKAAPADDAAAKEKEENEAGEAP